MITNIDGVVAGSQWPRFFAKAVSGTLVAGRPFSYWRIAGNPGQGVLDTTLNGVTLSSTAAQVAGQVNFTDPVSGNAYLSRLSASATQAGTLILCDRLWHNGGFTITQATAQNIVSPTWPARDANGETNGEGVLLGVEVSTACGAAAPTITIGYTNQDGTANRTATNWFPTANSPGVGSFFPIGLQAGDSGVRSVQSLTLSVSWVSGVINLVAYRPLATIELSAANIPAAIDAVTGGLPRLYNGTVPFFIFVPNTTTTSNISGSIIYTHG